MSGLAKSALAALVVGFGAAGAAQAQVTGYPGGYRPPVSPYINLLRGGNPAINYYGLVRPQVEFRNSIQGLQGQVGTIESDLTGQTGGTTAFPTTGHPVQFMNYSHYFPGRLASGVSPGSAPRVNPLGR